jgi:molybdopterin converting factor small subunit
MALVFGVTAVSLFAAVWSPPAPDPGTQPIFIGTFSSTEASANTISIRVTASASLQNVIGGYETEVFIPKGGTVAQLANRLTDRYPQLEPLAMVAQGGGMLPQSLELRDGQTVELMPPHSAGLTFLGKPLPTP